MGQIVRRKKKGRPSKADLAAADQKKNRKRAAQPAAERELRRSGRRRNVRYTFDFDDYLDDEEYYFVDDEEDERRREKKLKLLLKLHGAASTNESPSSLPPPRRRGAQASATSASSSDVDDKPSKKRKVDGEDDDDEYENENDNGNGDEEDDDINDDVDEDDDNEDHNIDDDVVDDGLEVKSVNKPEATKDVDTAPGTPTELASRFPFPDKKILEVILNKLQKKDIYGVYAEPVDPEELPDYHDVIEHPMDFSTIRSKLASGSYATLEQFEADVFLLCSNAMQYNAPDTIYHKQARSIQELAKKKFQKLRIDSERLENSMKSEPKPKSIPVSKKQIRRQISRTVQEPVGSDFSSGATLATAGDMQNGSNAVQAGAIERASSLDGLVDGYPSVIDTSIDKGEESLPGKASLQRFGRKSLAHDENRRATYNVSIQPEASTECVFSTFDGESKQLIPVGLYVDYAYARSLARFAGTLGPIAWKVASKRIEQILPPGTKFGRGWVGEYEPLPTPVLMLENCNIKEPAFFTQPRHTDDADKIEKFTTPIPFKDTYVAGPPLKGKLSFPSPAGLKVTTSYSTNNPPSKDPSGRGSNLEGKSSFFCSPGTNISGFSNPHPQHQNFQMKNLGGPNKKASKQVELNGPPVPSESQSAAHIAVERQISNSAEALTPRSVEMVSINRSFRPPNISGVAGGSMSNGRIISNTGDASRGPSSCSEMSKVATYFPHGQEQGLSDPVQLMRMLTERNQAQQKSSNQSAANSPPVPSPSQPLNREDSSSAAAVAARAWMSIGAGGIRPAGENVVFQKNMISSDPSNNVSGDQQSQGSQFRGDFPAPMVHFQPEKNSFPFHSFVPQPVRTGNAAQFQHRPMVFPQFITTDLSRFQAQSPWRSLSPHTTQAQKQDVRPPDLNVIFQAPGSPGRPSSGVIVDSQQPDLALQL